VRRAARVPEITASPFALKDSLVAPWLEATLVYLRRRKISSPWSVRATFRGEASPASCTAACRRGAYGIRTRATAVRGRRPRPLDECAVPRQGSRSRSRPAAKRNRGRAAGLCALAVRRTSEAFVRRVDCAETRMRLQGALELARREKGGPASCGPNAEPPIVPESFAVLPHAPNPVKLSGRLAYLTRLPARATHPRSRLYLAQSSG
jgi:hypothetical protein